VGYLIQYFASAAEPAGALPGSQSGVNGARNSIVVP
jgi:hypothetical protein